MSNVDFGSESESEKVDATMLAAEVARHRTSEKNFKVTIAQLEERIKELEEDAVVHATQFQHSTERVVAL